MQIETLTAADVRAMLAFKRIRIYRVAGLIGLHPARLSTYLNEHAPMPPDLVARINRAVEELEAAARR
jgi:DNA-binding transcriptional regulator YdaS (Cro superfamily)